MTHSVLMIRNRAERPGHAFFFFSIKVANKLGMKGNYGDVMKIGTR